MKILIATRNKDKFKMISNILKKTLLNENDCIFALYDLNELINDKTEVGDVSNRAYDKAFNVFNNLQNNIYDFIIGIDDVMQLNNTIIENVKDYIQDILDDKFLKNGDNINIIRAYTVVNKNGNHKNIITTIPFIYKKLTSKFDVKENSYPLSKVMMPTNNSIEKSEYTLHHSKNKILELANFIKGDNDGKI